MKIPQNKYQPPFSKKNLMDRLKFINFCRKQGVNISMSELKWLYENKIIFPAIRVLAGCLPIRKLKDKSGKYYHADDVERNSDLEELVNKKVYYRTASVIQSDKDWLDWYEERNMYSFPSQKKETVWITQESGTFSKMKDVPDNSELFYDKNQFIAIKLVLHELKITNNLSSDKKKMWQEYARKEVSNFYKCLKFYPYIQKLKKEWKQDSANEFQKFLQANENHKPNAKKDLKSYEKKAQKEKFQKKAQQLVENSKYNINDIEQWLKTISNKSFLRNIPYPFEFIKRYIQMIPEEVLREEYINNFSEEILWYWNLLRKKEISFKDYLYSSFDRTSCCVCGTVIPTGRKTCGKEECKTEYNNLKRKNKRKMNPEYGQ